MKNCFYCIGIENDCIKYEQMPRSLLCKYKDTAWRDLHKYLSGEGGVVLKAQLEIYAKDKGLVGKL